MLNGNEIFQIHFYLGIFLSKDGSLGVRGYGDPFLVSEEWQQAVRNLARVKILPRKLKSLFVDETFFGDLSSFPGLGHSQNPFDAPNGALVSNFNTIHVRIFNDGRVQSAEPQTPLTPSALRWAAPMDAAHCGPPCCAQRIQLLPRHSRPYVGATLATSLGASWRGFQPACGL